MDCSCRRRRPGIAQFGQRVNCGCTAPPCGFLVPELMKPRIMAGGQKMRKHECRFVPRLLLPRWESEKHAGNMIQFCRTIGADEMMVFPVSQFVAANPPVTDRALYK